MSSPSFFSTLYDCATECALRRQSKECKEVFGSLTCDHCPLNVNRYINADPRQVELFMLQAGTRASAIRSARTPYRVVFSLLIAFCLWSAYKSYTADYAKSAPKEIARPQYVIEESARPDIINETLRRVARDYANKVDVNNDGLTNCIDAAVLFYQYFPDKSRVCILVNWNTVTGMHHLFNGVLIDGVWRAIEPQAAHSNLASYWMKDAWGWQYDASLNKDETFKYLKYVK